MDITRRTLIEGAAAGLAAVGIAAAGTGTALASEAASAGAGEQAEEEPQIDYGTPAVPGYTCIGDWLGQAPAIDPSQITATYEADVVVVGAGHAGTQCALAAAEGGAKVMVVEMQDAATYSAKGGDICTWNSQTLTEQGFGGYDLGEVVAEYIKRGGQSVRPALISSYVLNSGETLDHIRSIMDGKSDMFDFDGGKCQVQTAYGCPDSSYYPVELGGFKMWASCFETLGGRSAEDIFDHENPVSRLTEMELYSRQAAEELGAEWFYGHTAVVLVQNEAGDVTGVVAQDADGNYVQFNAAKGVAVTTGDFTGDPVMVINLIDHINELDLRNGMDISKITGMSGLTGTGHKMMCWAGGFIESHPRPSMATIMANPGPWGTTPFLMLNSQGKRFMNEAQGPYAKVIMMHQPHGIVCNITDANYMQSVQVPACDHGAPIFGKVSDGYLISDMQQGMEDLAAGPDGGDVPNTSSVNRKGATAKAYKADTLEELLGYLGYEGEALEQALASVEAYNELCHAGVDTQFGKDAAALVPVEVPPFYGAVRNETGTSGGGMVTFTGLVTDDDMNVLRQDGTTPIKGLYCAGNTLGNRFGTGYNVPVAGSSVGMAITHGRVLGKHLAAL